MFQTRFFSYSYSFFLLIIACAFTLMGAMCIAPHPAAAQFDFINSSTGEATKITVIPQHPRAFENVTVSVEDFSQDINTATISWSLSGKSVARGTGVKSYTFTTGALGSVSNLTVSINGVTHTVSIRPADIDLIWQATTYVPTFYEGKALHTNQSILKIVAEPFFLSSQGTRLDPTTLIYNWKQNGKIMQGASGYGKQTLTVVPSVLAKPIDIEVTVTSKTGDYTATAQTTVEETLPEVVVYENSPLYGIQRQVALNNRVLNLDNQAETALVAVPFFFSSSFDSLKSIAYTWTQNSSSINKNSNAIIFRAPADTTGSTQIAVRANNQKNLMQSGNASLSIQFDRTQSATPGL